MDLSAVEAFVRAAEARSFTGAAKQMGLTASGVSKAVSRLESQTGVVLLHRSTRSVGLTAEGTVFFDRCREILAGLKDAEAALQQSAQVPSGRLRIAAPMAFGRSVLMPALVAFKRQFPDITIETSFSDVMLDIIEEGFDIAVRIGDLPSSRLIAREVGFAHWVACASPAYLNERGRPRTPDDLVEHDCVAYMSPDTRRCRDWHFMSESRDWTVRVGDSSRQVVDQCDALIDAALADSGIVYVHSYIAANHLRTGRLERVLDGYNTPKRTVHIIYPTLRQLSPKVRSFVDFAVEAIAGCNELYRPSEELDAA
jgi:LysR family transcriptional regulator, regulator for bpeEF and oprC